MNISRTINATSILVGVVFLCAGGAFVYLYLQLSAMPPTNTEKGAAAAAAAQVAPGETAIKSYTVRGRIVSLPAANGKQALEIHHEAIPTFVGKNGAVVGMKEMIMPFPDSAPGVTLDGLRPDDPIEFVFEVRWNGPPRTLVTRITKLPPETQLQLGPILQQGK